MMRSFHLALVLAVAALTSSATIVRAGETPAGTTRVEEDWELVISEPDFEGAGPQITTCMFPDSGDPLVFVAFNLNYRAVPWFVEGGVQIQSWEDEAVVDSNSQGSALCETTDEHITWTQRMSLSQDTATYSIHDGTSTTWGNFGQGSGLLHVSFNSPTGTLDTYDPDVSAQRSGVGWQENRVTSMTLLQVRYYSQGSLISTDTQPRPVVAED